MSPSETDTKGEESPPQTPADILRILGALNSLRDQIGRNEIVEVEAKRIDGKFVIKYVGYIRPS